MVDVFENAVSISIHDKDVKSIKTIDGTVVWEKERISPSLLYCKFTSKNVTFGKYGSPWNGSPLVIDWGDGTSDSVPSMNPSSVSHDYTDTLEEHIVIIDGSINQINKFMFNGNSGLVLINIPSTVLDIESGSFSQCTSLIKYVLNWESNPISFSSERYNVKENTVFEIPYGTTQLYENANYPSDKLVERSE